MKKIGLFYGSSSDNTKTATEFMIEYLEMNDVEVESFDIADCELEKIMEFDNIIIGCPTWNIGELQEDWDAVFLNYQELDFKGKTAAFFGCGDQVGYPDNFLDAIGILGKPWVEKGGNLIGHCDPSEYEFRESVAMENGQLMGLGLDYDNEDEKCEDQMIMWLEQIMEKFN